MTEVAELYPYTYNPYLMNTTKWYVAYTYPRAEKAIYQKLSDLGVETFLPLHKVRRKWSDRIKEVEVPLFSNYLFVNTKLVNIPKLTDINGIARFVSFRKEFATIREKEITLIKKLVDCGDEVRVEQNSLISGQRVLVNKGPFVGLEGKLIKDVGKDRFILSIEDLQQNISLNIPAAFLSPI